MNAILKRPKQKNGHKTIVKAINGKGLGMAKIVPDRQIPGSSPAEYEIHPLALIPPPLSTSDYKALEADMLRLHTAGLCEFREPIVLIEENGKRMILDGAHKYRIAKKWFIRLVTRLYDRAKEGDPALYVNSKALGRNMDASQKACASVKLIKEGHVHPKKGQTTREAAAQYFGANDNYVQKGLTLYDERRELFDKAYRGETKIPQALAEHQRLVKLDELTKAAKAAKPVSGKLWRLICGDSLIEIPKLKERPSLVFVDPPYNLGFDYGLGKERDRLPEPDYIKWCEGWIRALADSLADDGSMFAMIDNRHQAHYWWLMFKTAGLHFRNTLVWVENFGSHTNGNFTPCVRYVHYGTKHKTRFTWNGDSIRVSSDRQTKYDDARADPAGKVPGNYWDFSNAEAPEGEALVMPVNRLVGNAGERLQFPTQLNIDGVRRIVRVASNPGELVLDAFNGSGTTGAAAIELGRRYIGIDIVQRNIEWTEKRFTAQTGGAR